MASSKNPYELVLEFSRAREAGDPYAFQFEEQEYQLRLEGGVFHSALFPWNSRVLADLAELEKPAPEREAVQRLGNHLRAFLGLLEWGQHEAAIEQALAEGRQVHLCIRSAAAELYALPWELLTLKGSGQHLGEVAGCTLRYEWPRPEAPPRVAAPREGGRLLFAWSTAGGDTGVAAHLRALGRACEQGDVPFDSRRDVLGNVSLRGLAEALERAHEPVSVLHILCHGGRAGTRTYGLVWNAASEGAEPDVVDGARLRQVLAPYASTLKMVVLCACRSGAQELGSHLGSIAQELHRVGIGAVVASRLPLSVVGAIRMTEVLYGELLGAPASLERALGEARRQLALEGRSLDWASLQLYARAEEGPDLRPLALRPYRGLLAFEARHRRFFFGRDKLARALWERVRQAVVGTLPRFQVVAGASGAGKSSVVMAGLVPLLPEQEWDYLVVRPGELVTGGGASEVGFASLRGLRRRLRALAGSEPLEGGQETHEAELLEEARRLRQARPGRKLLLVVDQLEEVFTQLGSVEERTALMRGLWKLAATSQGECVVVGTLRVDHFERCAEVGLDERTRLDTVVYSEAHRVFVAHMEVEELAQAIERPAQVVGLELEAGLVEQMCQDIGQEPGALPLVEYALDLLWQRREGRRLTNLAYEQMGGVTGALTQTADQLYSGLLEAQRRQARRLLVRLVDFRDAASPQTRRRVRVEEVQPEEAQARKAFEEVLEKLVGSRLLVKGREEQAEAGGSWVQFAHEALIRRWTSLQTWVKEDWEREQQLRELNAWAEAWEGHQREKDQGASYLLTGDRLGYARRVRSRFRDELSARSLRFIASSEAAESRRTLLQRGAVLTLVLLLLAAVGAAGLAIQQREETERQRFRAIDAVRMGEARLLLNTDPTLASLVVREVTHPEITPEWRQFAVNTLRNVLSTAAWSGSVSQPVFNPDGTRVVTASQDGTVRVWPADGKGEPVVLPSQGAAVEFAAFSPDGKQVVTASGDGKTRVWPADGQGEPVVLPGDKGDVMRVRSVAFSPDGTWVVTAHWDRTVWVRRADGKGEPREFSGLEMQANFVAFSPDGQRLVTASGATVEIRRADGQDKPVVLRDQGEVVVSMAFSPDGKWVAMRPNTISPPVEVWRADGQGKPVVLRHPEGEALSFAAFSPEGKRVVTESWGAVQVWLLGVQDKPEQVFRDPKGMSFKAFSPDGKWLVTASDNGTARIHPVGWPAEWLHGPEDVVLRGHEGHVRSAAFSPDGKWLVTTSTDGTARVWRADGQGEPRVLRGQDGSMLSAAFSRDGKRVMTASPDGTARVWPVDEPTEPSAFRQISRPAAFSPDGERVVMVSDDGVEVRRTDGQGEPVVLPAQGGRVRAVAFSADGARVVTASDDGMARIWPVDGKGKPTELKRHQGAVTSAAFSQDGKWVVTVSDDGTARVWSAESQGKPVEFQGEGEDKEDAVRSAAISPDGKWVVMASGDGLARVRQADGKGTPVVLRDAKEVCGDARLVAFSANGKWLLTATPFAVCVWPADGKGEPVVLQSDQDRLKSAALSPDGKWVVMTSTAMNGTARVVQADGKGEPLVLPGPRGFVESAVFSGDGTKVLTVTLSTLAGYPRASAWAGTWTIDVAGLQALLRKATTACLSTAQRQNWLAETAEEAQTGHEQCERAHGRPPNTAPSER